MDLPVIDEAAIQATTVPAAAAAPTPGNALELAKLNITEVALAHFGPAQLAITAAETALKNVQHDLSTPAKLKDAISMRNRLIKQPVAATRATSTALKSKLTSVAKDVTTHEAKLVKEFERVEAYITPQITKREEEIAEEKRIDDERKARHTAGIARIAGYVTQAAESTAAALEAGIPRVESIDVSGFEEFTKEAGETKARTLASLRALHEKAVAREQAEEEAKRALALLADQQLVIGINARVMECLTLPAVQIREHLDLLNAAEYAPDAAEFVLRAHHGAVVQLSHLLARAEQAESDAAEMAKLRAAAVPAPVPPAPAPQPAPAPVEPVVQDPPRAFDRAADVTPTNAELDAEVDESARVLREDEELEARFGPLETAEGDAQPAAPAVVLAALANALPTHRVEALGDPLLLADVRSLVDDLMEAFRSKYPTQPKMGVDWWAGIRAKAELLQLQIGGAQ